MSATVPARTDRDHYRSPASAPIRALPVASDSLFESVARVLPGCQKMEPREAARFAKAMRHAHGPQIIAMRIGLRSAPTVLARYEREIIAAATEPLDSGKPLSELLVSATEEGAEGISAMAHALAEMSPEAVRRAIRECEEAMGALSLFVSSAKAQLDHSEKLS